MYIIIIIIISLIIRFQEYEIKIFWIFNQNSYYHFFSYTLAAPDASVAKSHCIGFRLPVRRMWLIVKWRPIFCFCVPERLPDILSKVQNTIPLSSMAWTGCRRNRFHHRHQPVNLPLPVSDTLPLKYNHMRY